MQDDETVAHKDDAESDPLTEDEIAAIQGYRDGRIKGIKFETADEVIRWLNRSASNSAEFEAAHGRDGESDPLAEDDIAAIQECRDGKVKGTRFKNADEAVK